MDCVGDEKRYENLDCLPNSTPYRDTPGLVTEQGQRRDDRQMEKPT